MLKVDIDNHDNHIIVYYWNDDGVAIRTAVLDLNHHIIQDRISEFDDTGRHICDVLFGADPTQIIAYREHRFTDDNAHSSGWTDYKKVGDEFIKLHSKMSYWIIKDKLARCDWFYADGTLAFYDLFKFDENIGEMCKEFSYFADDMVIMDYADKPYLEHFDDYFLQVLKDNNANH